MINSGRQNLCQHVKKYIYIFLLSSPRMLSGIVGTWKLLNGNGDGKRKSRPRKCWSRKRDWRRLVFSRSPIKSACCLYKLDERGPSLSGSWGETQQHASLMSLIRYIMLEFEMIPANYTHALFVLIQLTQTQRSHKHDFTALTDDCIIVLPHHYFSPIKRSGGKTNPSCQAW